MKNQNRKSPVLHFRRWGNKSYSAFCSLHQMVKVCVLSSAYFVSLGAPSLCAQSTEGVSKEINLDEIEISEEASDIEMDNEMTRVIAVVSKTEIEQSPAQSLTQLLNNLPGIDVRQRGAHSTQADLSIRAGSFDQVLVLLNGINISDPQTGHNNLNIPINLNNIERIEVLEGAGLRYNSEGAFAGAINIITKTPEQTNVSFGITGGSYNYWDMSTNLSFKQNNMAHSLDFNHTSSDGYRENTDFETNRIYYHSVYDDENINADFQLGFINNGFGANGFYSQTYPNQYEEINSLLSSLKLTFGKKVKISPKAYFKRSYDRFELFRNKENAASWYADHNYHQTDVWGVGSDFKFTSDIGNTSIGIDLRNENIKSNVLGEGITPIQHPLQDSVYFTNQKRRTNINAFANQSYYYNSWVFSGNLLLNYNGIAEEVRPYFGVDIAYQFSNQLSFKASINESFRMPTFTELYYDGSTNIGNADLKQEEAVTYDLGLDFKNEYMLIHLSGFHRRGSDIIDWVKEDPTDEKWTTLNYSKLNTSGIETLIKVHPGDITESLNFVDNIKTTFTYNYSKLNQQEYISYYALDYLKHKFTISADFNIYKKLKFSIIGQYQQRENPTTSESLYEPFWMCDASIRWEGRNIKPFLDVSNLFDTTYYDYNSLPQAGRWITCGVVFNLK